MSNQKIPTPDRISQCRIMVVGDVMLDRYWHGKVSRISPEAPVPVIHIQRDEIRLGGAANVALNIRTLGGRVTLLSMVGRDEAAGNLRSLLASHDIETDLGEDPNMQTIVKLRVIGQGQQMLRIDFETQPEHEVLAAMVKRFKALVNEHDAVLFSDYGKGGLTHIAQMIFIARASGKPVFVDPKGSDWACYAGATVITPNQAELAQVVGAWTSESEFRDRAEVLRKKLELKALLVTRAEEGMTLFEARRVTSVPAETREVADITGAGDTVIATLALLVACGLDLPHAIHLANCAAGVVVAKFGTASLSYHELFGQPADES